MATTVSAVHRRTGPVRWIRRASGFFVATFFGAGSLAIQLAIYLIAVIGLLVGPFLLGIALHPLVIVGALAILAIGPIVSFVCNDLKTK